MTGEQVKRTGFAEIKQEILRRVQTGTWPPGTLLPTEIELADEFGCARATMNRALRELADQGLMDRKRKSGTRVKTAPARFARFEIELVRKSVEALGASYRYALVKRDVSKAPDWFVSQFSISPQDQVMHLKCMHYADNRPFQLEERWVNIETVPRILDADLEKQSPNEWLVNEVPFSDAEVTLSAVAADTTTAEFLATSEGAPLFRLQRTTWLEKRIITFVHMTYRPGHEMTTKY